MTCTPRARPSTAKTHPYGHPIRDTTTTRGQVSRRALAKYAFHPDFCQLSSPSPCLSPCTYPTSSSYCLMHTSSQRTLFRSRGSRLTSRAVQSQLGPWFVRVTSAHSGARRPKRRVPTFHVHHRHGAEHRGHPHSNHLGKCLFRASYHPLVDHRTAQGEARTSYRNSPAVTEAHPAYGGPARRPHRSRGRREHPAWTISLGSVRRDPREFICIFAACAAQTYAIKLVVGLKHAICKSTVFQKFGTSMTHARVCEHFSNHAQGISGSS